MDATTIVNFMVECIHDDTDSTKRIHQLTIKDTEKIRSVHIAQRTAIALKEYQHKSCGDDCFCGSISIHELVCIIVEDIFIYDVILKRAAQNMIEERVN